MGLSDDPRDELHSWKEIAAYLDVNPRTAQKWEKESGLPIRRLGGDHGRVISTKGELEAWKRGEPNGASVWRSVRFLRAYAAGASVLLAIGLSSVLFNALSKPKRLVPTGAELANHEFSIAPEGTQPAAQILDTVETLRVGRYPDRVVFGPDGTRAYVANSGSGNISVVNTTVSPPLVMATVQVGQNPKQWWSQSGKGKGEREFNHTEPGSQS